ncbi:TPA-induced transmembrane protein homolog [Xyrichtys novacula]|uniref:TPA-induced transmembrane protein homolog n=1 Tax=Xyrichtys novacula TaxID=13765 RepID=A0AAV1FWR4_XYRNO|nr:TPA-induced transmembrane protein homolog [Xyrichtys novacula]
MPSGSDNMDIELQAVKTRNGDHEPGFVSYDRVTGNGESVANSNPDASEKDVLLSVQIDGCNGETTAAGSAAAALQNVGNTSEEVTTPNGETVASSVSEESQSILGNVSREGRRIKKELNEILFWKVRLWMAIIFVFFLIFVVIIISLLLCSAIHEDKDEKFDPSLFKFPLYFNGSFQLPNLVYTENLLTLSFNESQALASDLQEKLADLYRSSPALGRYFSGAEIQAFRNGSVIADYQLKFLMPEERQEQLKNYILSREMVYNVLRQFLYDQESEESGPMYIDPVSLNMFLKQ